MFLTAAQRSLIERLINTIETGKPEGDYGAISIYADGPHDIRQITYGRAQTTEYGNLRKLVQMYAAAGGTYSQQLSAYAPFVGSQPLTNDSGFKSLLRQAGRYDPVMKTIQDQFFEETYFRPAMRWADDNGFVMALSALVIYDSYIHSGQIFWFLRQKFTESPPAMGGSEQIWVRDYVNVRQDWLAGHHRAAVRASIYRTQAFKEQIVAGNWDLSAVPVVMNRVSVYPGG